MVTSHFRRHVRHIRAGQYYTSVIRRHLPANFIQQCGLSGTVRANNHMPFTVSDLEIHAARDCEATIRLVQILYD